MGGDFFLGCHFRAIPGGFWHVANTCLSLSRDCRFKCGRSAVPLSPLLETRARGHRRFCFRHCRHSSRIIPLCFPPSPSKIALTKNILRPVWPTCSLELRVQQ